MMFSLFHGGDDAFRLTCEIDFVRGFRFFPSVPSLYDSGDIGAEAVKKKKAFADMAEEQTMTRERWTNSKFAQHQLRIVLDNAYNPEAHPAGDLTEAALAIQQEDFFRMVRPALGNISVTHAMAILKCSAVSVFSNTSSITACLYRSPTPSVVEI